MGTVKGAVPFFVYGKEETRGFAKYAKKGEFLIEDVGAQKAGRGGERLNCIENTPHVAEGFEDTGERIVFFFLVLEADIIGVA